MNNENFSVLDMAESYAKENNIENVDDLFKKDNKEIENPLEDKEKKQWVPRTELIEGMDEINHKPVIYDKGELKVEEGPVVLKNIADDCAIKESQLSINDMNLKLSRINDAKKRFGIKHLQIPEGEFHVKIYSVAGDPDPIKAKEGLDEIFNDIIKNYPEFILEWTIAKNDTVNKIPTDMNTTNNTNDLSTEIQNEKMNDTDDVKIIIDKSKLPEISWSNEEIEKIRKSRSIELNIVEDVNLKYTNIEEVDSNNVDVILSQYQRKANDVVGALPASKYRATFTGLAYTEILDLSYSEELNNLDGERKKWSIAFNHIKNPSIGEFKEYKYYIDPKTKRKVILDKNADTSNLDENIKVINVSKFDDFLMKTSVMDLEYILWKILCATTMDKEIISITCHAKKNGKLCNHTYDWIYSPKELLITNTIDVAVLEDIKKTMECNNIDSIMKNYNESMLNINNTVELSSSKFGMVFGHISAYKYLEEIYGEIHSIDDNDSAMVSEALPRMTLTVIKYFILPNPNGGYSKISDTKGILKVINALDEIDFQTITQIMQIMIKPYQFEFALRNVCCPKCKNKSNIIIDSMMRLLFTIAQSLARVQVVLKRM